MPDYIGESIYLICYNKRYDRHFIQYASNAVFIEEMVGDAVENSIRYAKNFNGDKYNNAFGYINMIAYNAFVNYIKKEKKRYTGHLRYVHKKFSENDVRDVLERDNPNDIKSYTTYTDQVLSVLDDMRIDLPEIKKMKRKPKNILKCVMTGEEY